MSHEVTMNLLQGLPSVGPAEPGFTYTSYPGMRCRLAAGALQTLIYPTEKQQG